MVDRPRTVSGATSFHFSYISISKEALPTVNGAPVQGAFGKAKDAAPEEPVDRRRKPVDPTLFDLPVQEPPIKPGTAKAEYSDWDDLVNRIAADRIPVKSEKLGSGDIKFTVPSLSPEENTLLHARRFSRRVSGRLSAIHERQQQEIQRIHRWVKSQGKESASLVLEGRTASLGSEVRNAVRTLFRHWGSHPSVIEAIRDENDRRIELAKAIANQPAPQVKPADVDIELRKAEAARIYPQPDQAYTVQIRDFLRLLHEATSPDDLQSAADKIHEDPSAREDIYKHTTELAVAYRGYVEGADQRHVQRYRKDQRERGFRARASTSGHSGVIPIAKRATRSLVPPVLHGTAARKIERTENSEKHGQQDETRHPHHRSLSH